MMSRLALLATAVALILGATPVLAQTFSDYNGNDAVVTREQGNTAAVGQVGNPNYGGWNNGIPIIGPLFGAVTSPVAMATGGGWAQSGPACGVYHVLKGRYSSVCGLEDRRRRNITHAAPALAGAACYCLGVPPIAARLRPKCVRRSATTTDPRQGKGPRARCRPADAAAPAELALRSPSPSRG